VWFLKANRGVVSPTHCLQLSWSTSGPGTLGVSFLGLGFVTVLWVVLIATAGHTCNLASGELGPNLSVVPITNWKADLQVCQRFDELILCAVTRGPWNSRSSHKIVYMSGITKRRRLSHLKPHVASLILRWNLLYLAHMLLTFQACIIPYRNCRVGETVSPNTLNLSLTILFLSWLVVLSDSCPLGFSASRPLALSSLMLSSCVKRLYIFHYTGKKYISFISILTLRL
jgi:hypothetical protein